MADKIENSNISVYEIFSNLTFGELSQYAIGGAEEGKITEGNYPKVMSAINRGINEIQKDLSIVENTVCIRMIEAIHTYPIHSRHSLVTGTDAIKFVDDSVYEPFEDDILRIRQVYDECGIELPINYRNKINSIFVPQHNVIQHPFAKDGEMISVVYTRLTKPITVTTTDEARNTYLPIPDYTLDALYAYVASLMTAGITSEQELSESQLWRNEYAARIGKIEYTPSVPTDSYFNTKLTDNGFV